MLFCQDILGYAFRHAVHDYTTGPEYKINQKHLAHLRKMLMDTYGKTVIENDQKLNLYTDWILDCIQKSESISVFDVRIESNLDYVILSSLLRKVFLGFIETTLKLLTLSQGERLEHLLPALPRPSLEQAGYCRGENIQ